MPIYMDRHDVSDEVTAEHVAHIHKEDLKIQHNYNCIGLTYWFDDIRKTAFCLVDAPNKESLIEMHDNAHGKVPHKIIEVDPSIVESFLGRIEDPEKSKKMELNIINDPAFRIIVVITCTGNQIDIINNLAEKHEGRVVLHNLISFTSVTKALAFSVSVSDELKSHSSNFGVGVASGVPVSEKEEIFEDTIKLSTRFANINDGSITICSEVYELFMSENQNVFPYPNQVTIIGNSEETIFSNVLDFIDNSWQNAELQVDDFHEYIGVSKSKLYRVLKSLTGKSPNTFLKDYRLEKALKELKSTDNTVSEIAFSCGFNSPSYFSKCFVKKYSQLPSSFQNLK